MKPTFGIGVLVALLIPAAVALLGLLNLQGAASMALLLTGAWTIVAAFAIVASGERAFYAGWGIIITGLSLSYFVPIADALALILIAIVGLIVVTTYLARGPKSPTPTASAAQESTTPVSS